MKIKTLVVASAVMIAGAPVAQASLSSEYVAETDQCVLSYSADDVEALAVAAAVDKNMDAESYSAAALRTDFLAEAQRLREELTAGGGAVTVSREALDDPWMRSDAFAEGVHFYRVAHAPDYALGSSGSSMSSGLGAGGAIPESALDLAVAVEVAKAKQAQECSDGRDAHIETPDATQAVAGIEGRGDGGVGAVFGVLGAVAAVAAVVGLIWTAGGDLRRMLTSVVPGV